MAGCYLVYDALQRWPLSSDYFYDYSALELAITSLFWGIGFLGNAFYIFSDADTYVYEDVDDYYQVEPNDGLQKQGSE